MLNDGSLFSCWRINKQFRNFPPFLNIPQPSSIFHNTLGRLVALFLYIPNVNDIKYNFTISTYDMEMFCEWICKKYFWRVELGITILSFLCHNEYDQFEW